MSDINANEQQPAAGEQGNVPAPQSTAQAVSNAGDQAPSTPANDANTSPSTPQDNSSTTGSVSSTPSSDSDLGNAVSGASTTPAASGTSATPGGEGNATSVVGAGTTSAVSSVPATDSSNSPSGQTNSIPQGTLVNGNVANTVVPVIAPSSTQGYVPPGVTTAVTPVAPAAPAVNFVQTGINEVDQVVERLMKDCSTEAKLIINAVKDYAVKMKPGKVIAVKDGVQNQVSLYQSFLSVINNIEGNDFRPAMQSILALIHAHRDGAFRETHIFRFVEHVPLSAEHRKGFQKITTMLKTLANPSTRADLTRQLNFDPILKYGVTERGRAKLAAFFGK